MASGIRRTRHAEDLAFEDVQNELQEAFRRKEVLLEDISINSKACDAFSKQLRQLRPEIGEADDRNIHLESQLAQKSREIEDELRRQSSARNELQVLSEEIIELQYSEMQLQGELDAEERKWRDSGVADPPALTPRMSPTLGTANGTRAAQEWNGYAQASRSERSSSPRPPYVASAACVPTPVTPRTGFTRGVSSQKPLEEAQSPYTSRSRRPSHSSSHSSSYAAGTGVPSLSLHPQRPGSGTSSPRTSQNFRRALPAEANVAFTSPVRRQEPVVADEVLSPAIEAPPSDAGNTVARGFAEGIAARYRGFRTPSPLLPGSPASAPRLTPMSSSAPRPHRSSSTASLNRG
eukprot:TRINITY_DN112627_c0_g1_i1.p1 TRINITY_DN112627_c0_g1~~TRINITY_DN112627_c0_g1_i1.p1  ORF type:complete len:395 (+),score=88.34 TRINITY_DN112627_c0_g1_i1:140-1186(+)